MSNVTAKSATGGSINTTTKKKDDSKSKNNYSAIKYVNDDGNTSKNIADKNFKSSIIKSNAMTGTSDDPFRSIAHSHGLFQRNEIDIFNKQYRFGLIDPYNAMKGCREYLFFTKPDLNIYPRSDSSSYGAPSTKLNSFLQTQPYWIDLAKNHYPVIQQLQQSLNQKDKFNHLLSNMVISNLDIPGLTSEMIDTAVNTYGVGYQYHGSSEASNDSFDFSLEFKDTKYLPIYHFFRAYEDYQEHRHHGNLPPWIYYIKNRILYDQFSIYKFMVDLDDGETIFYYAKLFGVKSKNLPRDAFSNTDFSNGITYSIDFNAAFFEDMNPLIMKEFNALSQPYYDSLKYQINVHNEVLDRVDNRAAKAAYIVKEHSKNAGHDVFKLKWRGDDKF